HTGKLRFFFAFAITNLHQWTKLTQSSNYFFARFWVGTQGSTRRNIRSFYLLSFFHPLMECLVKRIDHRLPFLFAMSNFIKLFLNRCSEIEIDHCWKMIYQEIIYYCRNIGREKFLLFCTRSLCKFLC